VTIASYENDTKKKAYRQKIQQPNNPTPEKKEEIEYVNLVTERSP
jgi:hypothetical protein